MPRIAKASSVIAHFLPTKSSHLGPLPKARLPSRYRIGDELVGAPDPRVDSLPKEQRLSTAHLVDAILYIQRGKREEAVTNKRWVRETLRDDTPFTVFPHCRPHFLSPLYYRQPRFLSLPVLVTTILIP